MSLPISGGGRPRLPTHKPLALDRLMKLGAAVDEAAAGQPLTSTAMDELADDQGVDASHLYAAAALTTNVSFAREHQVLFVACVGGCQGFGALERIEQLVTLRQQRVAKRKPAFDIQPRRCLDQCQRGPVVQIHTPDGMAVLTEVTEATLADAVKQACS